MSACNKLSFSWLIHTDGVARNTNYGITRNYPIIAEMYVGMVFMDDASHSSPDSVYLFFLFSSFMLNVTCNAICLTLMIKLKR